MKFQPLIPESLREVSGVEDSQNPPELIRAHRILVADDDALLGQLVSTALVAAGFAVNFAADGEQAWEALRHEPCDLLVTDNEMSRLTGLKLIERIRKAGLRLPVIVASGSLSAQRVHYNPQLQIAAGLSKPFEIWELVDAVRRALRIAGDAAAGHETFCQMR